MFSTWSCRYFKKCKYSRKKINTNPIKIKYVNTDNRIINVLQNKNYSSNIWIKDNRLEEINLNNLNIYNNMLNESFEVDNLINIINYLNSTKLAIDYEVFKKIDIVANSKRIIDKTLISKNTLKNDIYQINNDEKKNFLEDLDEGLKKNEKFINNAATYELIKKQINEVKDRFFFLNYLLDLLFRIYCENWPINYQLNHIVRNCIQIDETTDALFTYKNFFSDKTIKKYIKNYKFFMLDYLKDTFFIDDFIRKTCKWGLINEDFELKIKKEILIIFLNKLSEKIERDLEKSLKKSISILRDFMNDDIESNIEFWIKKTKIKKIPYLINLHSTLKKIIQNNFNGVYWGDANSNAIQLITFRLGNLNEKLLQLTNIIENKTKYSNICDYVTEEIKENNHEIIIKILNYKLTNDKINLLQNKDDSKYKIMPGNYGMGTWKNLENMEKKLSDRAEIWDKLNKKEKSDASNYLWTLTFKILKEVSFDLNEYKKIFNALREYDLWIWLSDYGMPVLPINLKISKRQEILKKINKLEIKIKENKTDLVKKTNRKIKKKKRKRWQRVLKTD